MVKRYFEEAHIEGCEGAVTNNVNYVKKPASEKQMKA